MEAKGLLWAILFSKINVRIMAWAFFSTGQFSVPPIM